jgi:hypothetical protein
MFLTAANVRYGHFSTAHRRLKRRREEGVWFRRIESLTGTGYSSGGLSVKGAS